MESVTKIGSISLVFFIVGFLTSMLLLKTYSDSRIDILEKELDLERVSVQTLKEEIVSMKNDILEWTKKEVSSTSNILNSKIVSLQNNIEEQDERDLRSTQVLKDDIAAMRKDILNWKGNITSFADSDRKVVEELIEEQDEAQDLQGRLFAIEKNIQGWRQTEKVAFSVRVAEKADSYIFHEMTFDDIELNIGDAYEPKTNSFIAPYDGVYIFFANILVVDCKSADSFIGFTINNDFKHIAINTLSDKIVSGGANMLVTHLTKGEVVRIVAVTCTVRSTKHGESKHMEIDASDNTFSGFLLQPD